MEFETKDFFLRALKKHDLMLALDDYAEADGRDGRLQFHIPVEHSRILFFARQILSVTSPTKGVLVMPTEWGVWGAENWHLYDWLRKACAGREALAERPCHSFSADESDVALDFVYLFLLFSWDFYVFAYHENDVLFASHDGYCVYHSPNRLDFIRSKFEGDELEF